ncbi:MAG: hypothetical protein LBH43_18020 [Treponema sp.]|jgi:hypothetical protein|nr:hypothetical protein [Treponema sp.]
METIGINTPDNLYADIGFPEVRETREIPAGVAVKRGDILSEESKPIKAEGTVDCIALENIAVDSTIRICTVAVAGAFNANALFTGDSTTPEDWKKDLRRLCNIYLRHPAP